VSVAILKAERHYKEGFHLERRDEIPLFFSENTLKPEERQVNFLQGGFLTCKTAKNAER
jgi:hypothetical protein